MDQILIKKAINELKRNNKGIEKIFSERTFVLLLISNGLYNKKPVFCMVKNPLRIPKKRILKENGYSEEVMEVILKGKTLDYWIKVIETYSIQDIIDMEYY